MHPGGENVFLSFFIIGKVKDIAIIIYHGKLPQSPGHHL